MGGVGYEFLGNTITSSMDVLNYPLAAALSTVVIVMMLLLMVSWYLVFDLKTFLGKILGLEKTEGAMPAGQPPPAHLGAISAC